MENYIKKIVFTNFLPGMKLRADQVRDASFRMSIIIKMSAEG